MRKPIFESEEEAINFIENCIAFKGEFENLNVNKSILLAKKAGYIRRNPVDEAEEIYNRWRKENIDFWEVISLLHKQHEAIQYLQNQIVELNKKAGGI